jgi:outer membrane protein assembly factor BamB
LDERRGTILKKSNKRKQSHQPRREIYIERGASLKNQKGKNNRSYKTWQNILVVAIIVLIAALAYISRDQIARYFMGGDSSKSADLSADPTPMLTHTPLPTATPTPAPWHNPILEASRITDKFAMREIVEAVKPAALKFTSSIYRGSTVLDSYQRSVPIDLFDPFDYAGIAGVTTFRGNNFRNAPSFGLTNMSENKLEQIWERSMGGMASSSWAFSWSGTGWTGQPVMVQWPDDIREMMNLHPEKKGKKDLVEVITAAMDGNIYFYDLEDGKATRPAIRTGIVVKGTPALDPRGFPILYVGQGDYPPKNPGGEMGFRIFNLIDQSLLYFGNTARDNRANRPAWGALDSSPIIDGKADTLIFPCENGMIYTAKLNTVFDRVNGTIRISPEFIDYKYRSDATSSQGIESSMAIYGGYGFFADNSGSINCVDLNTMKPVWTKRLDDDNDVTPSLKQTQTGLFLYCGTEVDDQKAIKGSYQGDAFIYKFDALTGQVIWKNSYKAWTYNDPGSSGNDINGGIMGSLVIGKGKQSDLIIASICMTNGYMSGNTIAAFDDETGDLVWDYTMNHYTWSSPVDVYDSDGNMYLLVADSVSQIHLIDGSNGQRLDVLQIKRNYLSEEAVSGGNIESSPAVFGNILVIGTRGGLLAGVRLK